MLGRRADVGMVAQRLVQRTERLGQPTAPEQKGPQVDSRIDIRPRGARAEFEADIIYRNGDFIQWPAIATKDLRGQ